MHNKLQLAVVRRREKINCALREDIVVKGDGIDPILEDLERTWMVEDARVGIVGATWMLVPELQCLYASLVIITLVL